MSINTESIDNRAEEIERSFSYNGYQIVRRELFAHLREPALTIKADSIKFNSACIDGLEDAVYVHIMVSVKDKRIVICKCEEDDKDAVRWCIAKPDKRKSRPIKGDFSKYIYSLMGWNSECRYKVLGHRINYCGITHYVFELTECEIFRERPKRTKEENEARKARMSPEELREANRKEIRESMIPFSNTDAVNTFGLPVCEHQNVLVLDDNGMYVGYSGAGETQGDLYEK